MIGGSTVSPRNADNWDSFCSNASSTSFASPAVSVFLAGSASPAQVAALSCEASPEISLRRRSRRAADSSVRRTVGLAVFAAQRSLPFQAGSTSCARRWGSTRLPPYRRPRSMDLGHVLFGGRLFRERPRQHELGFEDRPSPFDDAVEGRRHPRNGRVLHQALNISDGSAGVALMTQEVLWL